MKRYIWLILISVVVVAVDQYTKYLIVANYTLGEHTTIINGFFHIIHSQNTGAAFGILRGAPDAIRLPILLSLPVLAFGVILWLLRSVKDKWRVVALALILGGAVGNFIDRISLGHVTDFLHFFHKGWAYPSFNVADSAICVGFAIWVLYTLFEKKR